MLLELLSAPIAVIMSKQSWREWINNMPKSHNKNDEEFHNSVKQSLSHLVECHEQLDQKDQTIKKLEANLNQEQFICAKIKQAKQHVEQKLARNEKKLTKLKQHKEIIEKLTKLNQELRKVKQSAIINYSNAAGEVHLLLDLLWDMYKSYNCMMDELKQKGVEWTEDDDSYQELVRWLDLKNVSIIEKIVTDLEEKHHEKSDYTICMTHTFQEEKDRVEMGEKFEKQNVKREDLF